ncbi:MAG: hypothetical protein EOO46_24585 [Flavobacterium sp.]|nr:MAG: hypothetical protein EOO46_24585 [Flavobacterium sp.]
MTSCHSLAQSKVLSPANKTSSSSFNLIDIPNRSFLSNDSFAKQALTATQEDSTPYLQYIAHEQSNSHSTGFNLQSKILSVLKKDDRTYNESVLVYKHLKQTAFFQKFRQDNPNLRLTDALINLSKILQYHVYSPGAIIHRKGDPSNKKVYLVFSGKIDLYETVEKKAGFETPRPPAPKIDEVKFVKPKVVEKEKVVEEIKSIEELKDKNVGAKDLKGQEDGKIVIDAPSGDGPQTDSKIVEDSNQIYTAVEVKPDFPGGLQKFYDFVGKNYKVPEDEDIKGKVFVQFVVERDGTLTDIKVIRDLGFGTGKEAIRVLKKSPKWKPGIQNGRPVRVLYSLPISIVSGN